MKAIIKEPGQLPVQKEIKGTLGDLQKIVDGYIEMVTLIPDRLVMICNEDGFYRQLPKNLHILNQDILGTVVFLGVNGEELDDIKQTDADVLMSDIWRCAI